jgi:hypothetical protein
MENNNKQSNILPLVIIFAVIVALIGGAYWFGKSNLMRTPSEEEISDVREPEEVIISEDEIIEDGEGDEMVEESDEDMDEAGDGEAMDEDTQETDGEVVDLFKQLFAEKYSKNIEEVNFEISEREGDYLTGAVRFEGEISGGYVLGAKVNDGWKIISDGNGNYTCDVVDVVDFPSSLAPECWDENGMQMVDRTAE